MAIDKLIKIKKECSGCGIKKSLESFYRGASKCKKCLIEYQKQRYYNNIKELREYQKAHYRENNIRYLEYKRKHYEKNPGIYIEKRKAKNNKKYFGGNKYKVLDRDKYKCQECGTYLNLIVHHIDGNGRGKIINNNNLNNLITLCNSCHVKLHWKLRKEKYASRNTN